MRPSFQIAQPRSFRSAGVARTAVASGQATAALLRDTVGCCGSMSGASQSETHATSIIIRTGRLTNVVTGLVRCVEHPIVNVDITRFRRWCLRQRRIATAVGIAGMRPAALVGLCRNNHSAECRATEQCQKMLHHGRHCSVLSLEWKLVVASCVKQINAKFK